MDKTQTSVIGGAHDKVAQLFRNNGFTPSTQLGNPDFLSQAQDLSDTFDLVRTHLRNFEAASDGRVTLDIKRADSIDDIRADRLLEAAAGGSDDSAHVRWQGQVADADGLVDLSTDDVRSLADGGDDAYSKLGSGDPARASDDFVTPPGTDTVRLGDGDFPSVPPRLPDDVDADRFAEFIRARRDGLLDAATSRPPTGATPADIRVREEIRAYDLALEALARGDDPLPLIGDRIRTVGLQQARNTLPIGDEAEVLLDVRQTLDKYLDTVRDGAGLYDDIMVGHGRRVDQLRLDTQSSLANVGSAGDDYVSRADAQLLGLRGDVTTQPTEYAEINVLAGPVAPPELDTRVTYSKVNIGAPAPAQPPVLSFLSDNPTRLVGSVQSGGSYNTKPLFQLTDSEFAAVASGDLRLSIVDAGSFNELGSNAFELTAGRVQFGAEQSDLAAASDISAFGQGDGVLDRSRPLGAGGPAPPPRPPRGPFPPPRPPRDPVPPPRPPRDPVPPPRPPRGMAR